MRQRFRNVWPLLRRKSRGPARVRLGVEELEDRSVPSANFTGTLSGVVFISPNGGGSSDPNSIAASGVAVTLTGTTILNAPVSATATTDAGGNYSFTNLIPGTYQVSAGNGLPLVAGLGGSGDATTDAVGPGQSVNQDLPFGGVSAAGVSLRYLASNWTPADLALSGPAGSGVAAVNSRPDSSPVVSHAVANFSVAVNSAPTQIDLAGVFSDPDTTDSTVTFNTSDGPINVTLFDTTAPQTVANFLDYVQSGAYDNIFFSRLMSNFVLQGGGASLQTDASGAVTGITAVPANPPVPNEFGASNTADTLAMALSSDQNNNPLPNSGTNQFFFNLVDNSSSLDAQQFTVFGQIADSASANVLSQLASATTQDEHTTPAAAQAPDVGLSNVPMVNYTPAGHFPTDATAGNFEQINGVTIDQRTEALTYSVVSNSNPGLVTAGLKDEHLTLNYAPGATGTAVITVRATDDFGATVDDTFTVHVLPFSITSATNPVTAANEASVSVAGKTEPGATVSVTATDGTNTLASAPASVDASGNWTIALNVSSLADGTITYTAVTTDAAGDTATTTATATKHAAAPAISIISVTNPIDATNDMSTTASGTTAAGDTVSLTATDTANKASTAVSASVDASGNWVATGIDVSGLADGTITYTATATDPFGNTNSTTMTSTKNTSS